MEKLVETVPNFSEGRDREKIEQILTPFRGKSGVHLLDVQNDEDHNRMVVTAVGRPEEMKNAVVDAIGVAVGLIDMTCHQGQHPRMGAVDVVPFIPIRNMEMAEAVDLSKQVAEQAAAMFNLPVFLYEASAATPRRADLAAVRKGEFEGMPEKLKAPAWKPDFGPTEIHPTAGVTAIGARMPLIAYNVNLDTDKLEIADAIAKTVRHISGGFRFCKALGIELKDRGLKDRGQVQVSMNLTNYKRTSIYRVLELIRLEARRYGVQVVGSEIVGLVPMEALFESAAFYLGLENFSPDQVLESRLME